MFHASFFNRVIAMRFKLVLEKTSKKGILPINYQYPLSACIYKVIQSADEEFSRFLHTDGYALGHKKFKLFTFSPLRIYPFRVLKEYQRLEMTSDYAELEVRFTIDKAAESFITGLFHNQHLRIADRIGGVDFTVVRIEALTPPLFTETMRYSCISPVCIGHQPLRARPAQYLSPEEINYPDLFLNNLISKLAGYAQSGGGANVDLSPEAVHYEFRVVSKPRSKLIAVKAMTEAETRVKGWLYDFLLTAPVELQELGYYAGFGEKNSMGFGCVAATD